MKSPKETNNQVITNDELITEREEINEIPELDDYSWDDNKQHTEQYFF